MNNIDIEEIATKLNGKKTKTGWQAHCPIHVDESPSLSLSEKNGNILVYCHAGCAQEDVWGAIKANNFPNLPKSNELVSYKKVDEYIYLNTDLKPALKIERQESQNGKKKFCQFHSNDSGKTWNLGSYRDQVLPYRYEKWKDSQFVFLVEGEKCVQAIERIGYRATTAPGGSNGWQDEFAQFFKGKKVTILPDQDLPGKKYAKAAFTSLKNYALEIKVISLPDLKDKEDVVDYLNGVGTKEKFLQICKNEKPCTNFPEQIENVVEIFQEEQSLVQIHQERKWPNPLAEDCFHGIAGKIIRSIEPETEADPPALLFQFLTVFGNIIGRNTYYPLEADKQHTNLFVNIVGDSAKARKGTSWSHIRQIFEQVDADYMKNQKASGLSSGEGVIWHVRDEVKKHVPNSETGFFEEKVIDPGIDDKRLLVVETEFASVLQALKRDGNKLSAIIRDLYDAGNIRTITKNDPVKATNAHVSVIGHITGAELQKLGMVELLNGFYNRFITCVSRRTKLLPLGGNIEALRTQLTPLIEELKEAIIFARTADAVTFSESSKELWKKLYISLSKEKRGLLGTLSARSEAHIIRVASIYALLDKTTVVADEHLRAAIGIWEYAEESLHYLFGGTTGNPIADKILAELRFNPEGMNQTKLHGLFNNNLDKARLAEALHLLKSEGHILDEKISNGTRNVVIWKISSRTNYESNELNENSNSLNYENSSNSYFVQAGGQ